jgi:hypothetical protein
MIYYGETEEDGYWGRDAGIGDDPPLDMRNRQDATRLTDTWLDATETDSNDTSMNCFRKEIDYRIE